LHAGQQLHTRQANRLSSKQDRQAERSKQGCPERLDTGHEKKNKKMAATLMQ
jgi:hypothetical protein